MLYTPIIRVNVAHAAARAASDCAPVAEATAAGTLGLPPLDWRIDASTVLRVPGKAGSPPANKGPVLKFARNVLQLRSDLDGRDLTTCNLPQLLAVVRDWETTNAVCLRTVGSWHVFPRPLWCRTAEGTPVLRVIRVWRRADAIRLAVSDFETVKGCRGI
jgi:hypothetical protein